MERFYKFKKYVYDNSNDKSIWRNKFAFFRVKQESVEQCELELKIKLPSELKDFYREIGYGFVRPDDCFFVDRIMTPNDIVDFIRGNNAYANDERRKYYLKEGYFPFYEVSETTCLTIEVNIGSEYECAIYYEDEKIADSLLEFLNKMEIEADYYLEEE